MQNTASSASSSSSISSQSELSPSIVNNLHNASAPVEILKRPAAARKKRLEDDPWTADVSTVSVNCLGCGHLVRLSTKSLYDNHHWLMHKQRCKRAGNIKDNPDIGQSSPRQPAVVQTKSKSKPKLNRKAKRPPSASSSVSSLTPISTPPLTSDEEGDVDVSSTEESELPPRRVPIRTSGKRDLLTEQYFARAHGIRIRLPPISPETPDTHIDWRNWKWSELRMPEFITGPASSTEHGSEDGADSDAGSVKTEFMTEVEGSKALRSRATRAQSSTKEEPMRSSSSHHA